MKKFNLEVPGPATRKDRMAGLHYFAKLFTKKRRETSSNTPAYENLEHNHKKHESKKRSY